MMKMKLWILRRCIFIILIIGMIRFIQLLIIIDKMNISLILLNNNINNIAIITNSKVVSSSIISTQQQQPQQESTSLVTTNTIPKGLSSCYKTRLRIVYPLYGNNGCINEIDLAENNVLGYSKFLESGDLKTRIYCRFYQYKIQLKHMKFMNYGGENIKDVIGQDENVEFIQYQSTNTFIITTEQSNQSLVLQQQINDVQNYKIHYIKDILSHTTIIQNGTISQENNDDKTNTNLTSYNEHNKPKCTQYISGTTYLIQRYEYANFFHTMTDWWNTWLAIDSIEAYEQNDQQQLQNNNSTNIPHDYNHKKQIIFLDSHLNGILDDVRNILFHNYSYIGQYAPKNKENNDDNVLCFDDAVLVPAGYASDFVYGWHDDSICKDYITTERFVNYVLDHFHIKNNNYPIQNLYHVIYIDRRPYLSHPRATIEKDERTITNLDHVATVVQKYVDETFNVSSTYEIIQLDQYSMMEQISRIRTATILFGYHGAGLSHLLFLNYNAGVIEIKHGSRSDLFVNMAKWKKKIYTNNVTLTNGTIIHDEEYILHYQFIPSLYSRNMTDQYIESYLLPAFHSIIIKQQEQQKLKRNILSL